MIFSILLLRLGLGQISVGASDQLCTTDSTATSVAAGISLKAQVAIVTGSNTGIGYAFAYSLAKQGATVVIATDNLQKCQSAAHNISAATNATVFAMELDLGSFKSVRKFAQQFEATVGPALNYLYNNAGIQGGHLTKEAAPVPTFGFKTEDGFEGVFQINYLGHFLLTELLLPALRLSAGLGKPAKIVNTASTCGNLACQMAFLPADCFKDWTYLPIPVFNKSVNINGTMENRSTYGMSKFALMQHAEELAVREAGNGIQANAMGPGLVDTAENKGVDFKHVCPALPVTFGLHQDVCPYSAQQASAALMALALHTTDPGAWYTRYTNCSDAVPVSPQGFTDAMRSEFYRRSQMWVGIETSATSIIV